GSCPRNSSDVRRHRPWRRSIGASAGMQPSRFGNGRQWEWNGRTLHIGTGIDPLVKFIRTLWNPTLFSTCIAKGDDLKTAAMHRPQLQAAAPQLGLIASIRRPGGVESDDAYSSRRARTPRTTLAIVPSSRPSGGMRPRAARRPPFARDDTGLPVRSRFRVVRAGATPVEHQRRGMPMNGPTRQTPSRALRRAALPAALLLALAALPAAAQQPQPCPTADDPDATCAPDTTPATELDRVEVRGLRASMIDALQIKQGSMQIVDAIVAEDIGKFPDNNLVEALQRVTGVQTTDRGGGEVSTVSIRGLNDVTTTINGRNIFTASGRAVALADIPASLLSSVEIYKTRSASLIETGIAGVIDIHTHRPFDFDGATAVVAARTIHQEQSKQPDPNLSALVT